MHGLQGMLLALFLVGCTSVPVPTTGSADSPAHPEAPEAVTPPLAPGLSDSAQPARAENERAGHDAHPHEAGTTAPAAPSYTCPMHPEVTSDEPGTCPKCGMTLVPADSGEHQH